jgi:hypothetical protein
MKFSILGVAIERGYKTNHSININKTNVIVISNKICLVYKKLPVINFVCKEEYDPDIKARIQTIP